MDGSNRVGLLVVLLLLGSSMAVTPGAIARTPAASFHASIREAASFVSDPNATGNLKPWQRFDPGNAASSNGIRVSSQPNGATSPGIVRVVRDPLGKHGKVIQETVTPAAHASDAGDSDATYLWNPNRTAYLGNNGQSNWIHYRLMFPRGYRPTHGEWNIENEFHNNSEYKRWVDNGYMSDEYPEVALYVTSYTGHAPGLMYRVRGGRDAARSDNYDGRDIRAPRPLRLNHWYDIVLHIVWSPDPKVGRFEWWLDGKRIASIHRPTLWQRPDGSYDHTDIELNNYRKHATWSATVFYGRLEVGSTRSSIRFPR